MRHAGGTKETPRYKGMRASSRTRRRLQMRPGAQGVEVQKEGPEARLADVGVVLEALDRRGPSGEAHAAAKVFEEAGGEDLNARLNDDVDGVRVVHVA